MHSNEKKDYQPEKEDNFTEDHSLIDEEEQSVELYDRVYSQEANEIQEPKKNTPNLSEESSKKSTKLTNQNSSENTEKTKEKCIIKFPPENIPDASQNQTNSSPIFPIPNNFSPETNNSFVGKKPKDAWNYLEPIKEAKGKTFEENKNKQNPLYQVNFYKVLSPEKLGNNIPANQYYGNEDDALDPSEFNFESNIKEDFCEKGNFVFLMEDLGQKEKINLFDYQGDEEEKPNIPYYQDNGEGKGK